MSALRRKSTGARQAAEGRVSVVHLKALAPASAGIRLGWHQRPDSVLSDRLGGYLPHAGLAIGRPKLAEPGDEVRRPDAWASARNGRVIVRHLVADRARPLIVVTDLRTPMQDHDAAGGSRAVTACEAAALFVHAAASRGDRIGGAVLDDTSMDALPPRRSRTGEARLLTLLAASCSASEPDKAATPAVHSLAGTMDGIARQAVRDALVVVIGGFFEMDAALDKGVRHLARRNHVLLCPVIAPDRDIDAAGIPAAHLVALAACAGSARLPLLPLHSNEATAPQLWRLMGYPA